MMAPKSIRRSGLRFSVAVEFLAGLLGFYGVGRLFARRLKEARILLIVSLLLIVPFDLTPRLLGDQYALWLPWLIKGVLAAISAFQLNYVLSHKPKRKAAPRR
jgi:hypothetical protein